MSLIYFAHPIDAPGVGLWETIALIATEMQDRKLSYYYPAMAFVLTNYSGRQVNAINEAAQRECDATLAYYPAGSHSYGVPTEIARAVDWGQPVAIISDTDGAAWPLSASAKVGRFKELQVGDAVRWLDVIPMLTGAYQAEPAAPDQQPLPVRMIDPLAQLPTRGHADDAGLDLYVTRPAVIWPHTFTDVHCGLAAQLPAGTWGYLTGRSSTLRTRGLLVNPGVIDCGYRGELYAGCWNLTDEPVRVEAGERLAQLVLIDNATERYNPIQVEALGDHPRGANGFGSTGR